MEVAKWTFAVWFHKDKELTVVNFQISGAGSSFPAAGGHSEAGKGHCTVYMLPAEWIRQAEWMK